MEEDKNLKAFKRHIARCLDDLGCSISPSQAKTIKLWFWRLYDDTKQGNQGEENGTQDRDDVYNR
jgi:hypothetical protein